MSDCSSCEDYFDENARTQIESDFDSKCVLCKAHLQAGQGHFVPLLNDHRTLSACVGGLYTWVFKPYEALSGLYACQPCAHQWLKGTDDVECLAVLVPCKPLMLYALHALRIANDEASRSQTLDAIFQDLENDPSASPERRLASPFLHCYQICPVLEPCESSSDTTSLLVWPSPSTYLTHDDLGWPQTQGSNVTRYCILEPSKTSASVHMPSRTVPLYGQCGDGAVTLWRIHKRSPGLFCGLADSTSIRQDGNHELSKIFHKICFVTRFDRGLPSDYRKIGLPSSWDVFNKQY
ncbi:hypothetical protein PENSPDRAFT_649835 [Peniophora sp. CONT]|nr:hypothetical protein PENSPDRAFT_649835 [Peniophora sp. CONT]